ncbi:MAG: ATP-binding protein [Alphaproteobacteria bacterium]|nr:ATP-binding protein [Alphaproteobacteria bacterium]
MHKAPDPLELTIENDLAQLAVVRDQVDSFAKREELSRDVAFAAQLVLEELLANTISYGYGDESVQLIEIRLEVRGDQLIIRTVDGGLAFDPRTAKEPNTKASLEDREIGGLGVHFVKTMMDKFEYRHEDGKNYVTLKKGLK